MSEPLESNLPLNSKDDGPEDISRSSDGQMRLQKYKWNKNSIIMGRTVMAARGFWGSR